MTAALLNADYTQNRRAQFRRENSRRAFFQPLADCGAGIADCGLLDAEPKVEEPTPQPPSEDCIAPSGAAEVVEPSLPQSAIPNLQSAIERPEPLAPPPADADAKEILAEKRVQDFLRGKSPSKRNRDTPHSAFCTPHSAPSYNPLSLDSFPAGGAGAAAEDASDGYREEYAKYPERFGDDFLGRAAYYRTQTSAVFGPPLDVDEDDDEEEQIEWMHHMDLMAALADKHVNEMTSRTPGSLWTDEQLRTLRRQMLIEIIRENDASSKDGDAEKLLEECQYDETTGRFGWDLRYAALREGWPPPMPNAESQMTNECRIPKHESPVRWINPPSLVLRHSFDIWISTFVIP